ncbi:lipid A-modifier LpxR family protein [uncultured Winogradskyella sp.]|uniref:lipid A-modifier LpxR family protein n=1 Tax=uncultured Winogradskyella sp. TaxID=395353 RepID=UPI0026016C49|nr:lipid A-modifier LpxR family protein [uncultured Winogradskyella sp.]
MAKFSLCFSLFAITVFLGYSQSNNTFSQQLQLQHDNDFITLTDRYYSSGLYLRYRKLLSNPIFNEGTEQVEFSIQQEIYTPSQTKSTNIDEFDRSYAGFVGLGFHWLHAKENNLLKISALAGIVGPNSGAGGFQRWYHNTLVISDPPIWVAELRDSFQFNLYSTYAKEWTLVPNPFGMRIALLSHIALGTRDIYLEPELVLSFGRKAQLKNSIFFDLLGVHNHEIYFTLNAAYRNVIYNGIIEGNLFGDDSQVLRESQNALLRFGFDFHNKFGQNNLKIGVRYNSRETLQSKSHKYIILGYGYSFN